MSNINKQSQSLDKIAGVQDISHESAAACSGGLLTLYDGTNGTGAAVAYVGGVGVIANSLSTFNNRASSFKIEGNQTVRFYTGQNRTGVSTVVGGPVGQPLTNIGFVGFTNFDNNIESLQFI